MSVNPTYGVLSREAQRISLTSTPSAPSLNSGSSSTISSGLNSDYAMPLSNPTRHSLGSTMTQPTAPANQILSVKTPQCTQIPRYQSLSPVTGHPNSYEIVYSYSAAGVVRAIMEDYIWTMLIMGEHPPAVIKVSTDRSQDGIFIPTLKLLGKSFSTEVRIQQRGNDLLRSMNPISDQYKVTLDKSKFQNWFIDFNFMVPHIKAYAVGVFSDLVTTFILASHDDAKLIKAIKTLKFLTFTKIQMDDTTSSKYRFSIPMNACGNSVSIYSGLAVLHSRLWTSLNMPDLVIDIPTVIIDELEARLARLQHR